MEWPIVNDSVKKSLLIIMKRAMIPIEISTVYILTMNLDSFVTVSINIYLNVYNIICLNNFKVLKSFIAAYNNALYNYI